MGAPQGLKLTRPQRGDQESGRLVQGEPAGTRQGASAVARADDVLGFGYPRLVLACLLSRRNRFSRCAWKRRPGNRVSRVSGWRGGCAGQARPMTRALCQRSTLPRSACPRTELACDLSSFFLSPASSPGSAAPHRQQGQGPELDGGKPERTLPFVSGPMDGFCRNTETAPRRPPAAPAKDPAPQVTAADDRYVPASAAGRAGR